MHYGMRAAIIAALPRVNPPDEPDAPSMGRGSRAAVARWAFDRGGILALVCLVLYVWLAPVHIVDGDNAELVTLGHSGGAAHPPGYPLCVLWLRALSWLPGSSPAHVAALATVVAGGTTVLVLHAACRAWGARPLPATFAVGVFAVAPAVLRMNTEAEVFALNNLVVALVLWLSAARAPLRGVPRVVVLAALGGLGLSDHLTCVLVAPVGLLGVVRGVREAAPRRPLALALGVLAFAAGLTPYLYLLVAPDTPMSWGQLDSVRGLVDHVLRKDYGGPTSFAAAGEIVTTMQNFAALADSLASSWLGVLPVVGLGTIAWAVARPRQPEGRWAWIMLGASWLLAGPLLVARFDVPLDNLGRYVVGRFHILPVLLLAIPIAVGIDALMDRFATRLGPTRTTSRLGALATSALIAVATLRSLPHLRAIQSPAMERGISNILRALPPDAVLFAGTDDFHFGALYVQTQLAVRPDVTVITWSMSGLAWYQHRLRERGVVIPPGEGLASLRTAEALLAAGRPVFADATQAKIRKALPTYPYAGVFRVLPRSAPAPSLDAIVRENREAFGKFDLDYPRPGTGDEYATIMHSRYAETWWLLGTVLRKAGRVEDAQFAFGLAQQLGPDSR